MRVSKSLVLLAAALVCSPAFADAPEASDKDGHWVKLSKSSYQPGEDLGAEFKAPKTLHKSAWFGVVPSSAPHGKASVNDRHDVSYSYVYGKTEGKLKLKAPGKPGKWTLRLSDATSANDREILSVEFVVEAPKNDVKPSLTLPKATFNSHETFKIQYTVSHTNSRPWIGVVKKSVPHGKGSVNDRNDSYYTYVKAPSGEATIRVPGQPGEYEVRLSESGGDDKELAAVGLTVVAPEELAKIPPALTMSKTSFTSHQTLEGAEFTAPCVYDYNGWIGIVASDVEHGKASINDRHDHIYAILRGRTKGPVKLRVPGLPGKYDLRMHDSRTGKEVATVSFEVKLPEGGDLAPKVTLDKGDYKVGDTIQVSFEAPASLHYSAWVGIVPADVEHGKTSKNDSHDVAYAYIYGKTKGVLKLKVPAKCKPGKWTVRMSNFNGVGGDGLEKTSVDFEIK